MLQLSSLILHSGFLSPASIGDALLDASDVNFPMDLYSTVSIVRALFATNDLDGFSIYMLRGLSDRCRRPGHLGRKVVRMCEQAVAL